MAEYPTINEPREDVHYPEPVLGRAPSGPRPSWARSEDYVRWGLTVVYVGAMAGLATTLGGSVAPWLGWIVLLVASGAPALMFWGKFVDSMDNRDRAARAPGAGSGPRFTGGTSFSAGPGRDDDHRADPSDQDVTYP